MQDAHKKRVAQTLFVRAIENGMSHKARICFRRLRRLLEARRVLSAAPTFQLNVAQSFQEALSNAGVRRVSREFQRGLELLEVVIAGTLVNKRAAFEAILAKTRQSTKRDMGRIMRLLSKKFLTKVDDKFLSEHIRVLILKNKIHNPSILNLVKQTDIDISQEDYGASANIRNTEALLQIFLAIELFLPVDLWVIKIKEAYNRLFFRLLRSHAAAREQLRRKNALSTLLASLEKSVRNQLESGLETLRTHWLSRRQRASRVAAGVAALGGLIDGGVQARVRREFETLRSYALRQKAVEKLADSHRKDLLEGLAALKEARKSGNQGVRENGSDWPSGRELGVETDSLVLNTHDFSLLRNFVDRPSKNNGGNLPGRERVVQASGGDVLGSEVKRVRENGTNFDRNDSNKVSRASTALEAEVRLEESPALNRRTKGTSIGEGLNEKQTASKPENGPGTPLLGRKGDGFAGAVGKSESGERSGPVAPHNRYSKSTATTLSPNSRFQQTGEGGRGESDARGSQAARQPAVLASDGLQNFKSFLKWLERLMGVHNTKNLALAFDRMKNEVTILEVLETKDMTKDLDPIGIRLANERSPQSQPSSENVSIHRQSIPFEASVRNKTMEVSDVVFIRKSNFFPAEAQVSRYSQIVKPQSQLLDQMAEVRKEEGSRRSFVLPQGLAPHHRYRHLTSSMVLEPTTLLESKKRSFATIKEEDFAAGPTTVVSKGLRARYK